MCSLWNMDTWNLVVKFCAHVVYIFVLWHGWISLTLWTSGERLMPSKTGSTRRRTIACFECAYSELMKQIFFKLKRVKRSSWITILFERAWYCVRTRGLNQRCNKTKEWTHTRMMVSKTKEEYVGHTQQATTRVSSTSNMRIKIKQTPKSSSSQLGGCRVGADFSQTNSEGTSRKTKCKVEQGNGYKYNANFGL